MSDEYVALLRGINVGGARIVEMSRLRSVFADELGFEDVRTYINSGNVLFRTPPPPRRARSIAAAVAGAIEAAVLAEFGFPVAVLVRTREQIAELLAAVPPGWRNDAEHKCDVLFLFDEAVEKGHASRLEPKEGIDEVVRTRGEIVWRVPKPLVTRSGLMKLAGSPLYSLTTVRNVNTTRKLGELLGVGED